MPNILFIIQLAELVRFLLYVLEKDEILYLKKNFANSAS